MVVLSVDDEGSDDDVNEIMRDITRSAGRYTSLLPLLTSYTNIS